MGALPDHEPQPGAPYSDPESAPPLQVVPGQRPVTPAPPPSAPPPAPPAAPEEPRRSEEPQGSEEQPAPENDAAPQEETDDHVHTSWWERLNPPDIWDSPAPTLREEVARARRGDHLPETGLWRMAEQARMGVSVSIIAMLLLLVHINRSAARQGLCLAGLAALFLIFR